MSRERVKDITSPVNSTGTCGSYIDRSLKVDLEIRRLLDDRSLWAWVHASDDAGMRELVQASLINGTHVLVCKALGPRALEQLVGGGSQGQGL
jgi:hypothetical protein